MKGSDGGGLFILVFPLWWGGEERVREPGRGWVVPTDERYRRRRGMKGATGYVEMPSSATVLLPLIAAEHRTPSATRSTEARCGPLVLRRTAELLYVFGGFTIPRERASWLRGVGG
ncbi:hypothetical protein BHM03_00018372 [Ensete ventricosum]|nr:hypothetical protein BHM03_00018372 [Ensete ventricosum]